MKLVSTKRRLVSVETERLRSYPFAALAGHEPEVDPTTRDHTETAPSSSKVHESPVYEIARTRKGGYPVFVEKRAKGKTVTVVRNVTGDLASLAKTLKTHCGAGGVARDDSVEIQGNHKDKIIALLEEGNATKGNTKA